jgi:hypothetical protein
VGFDDEVFAAGVELAIEGADGFGFVGGIAFALVLVVERHDDLAAQLGGVGAFGMALQQAAKAAHEKLLLGAELRLVGDSAERGAEGFADRVSESFVEGDELDLAKERAWPRLSRAASKGRSLKANSA